MKSKNLFLAECMLAVRWKSLSLCQINFQKQKSDILLSLEFLEEVGAPTSNWIMCYPYGSYNDSTLSILKELDATIGVTTEPRKLIY